VDFGCPYLQLDRKPISVRLRTLRLAGKKIIDVLLQELKTCQYFEVKVSCIDLYQTIFHNCCSHMNGVDFRQSRGLRSKARRLLSQFSPHDFTAFKWEGTTSFLHYFTVVLLLAVFLMAELNPFYLKVSFDV